MTTHAASRDPWLSSLPKVELHLHIDGSLSAGRLLALAEKHGVALPWQDEAAVHAAYDFKDLQSFLDLYYVGASVLRDAEDFYHLMLDYLRVCRDQNIRHCEIMVEPQAYLPQEVPLAAVMEGFLAAMSEARRGWGQSVMLILSVLRHLPEEEGLRLLDEARPWREHFCAIGLASSETGHPPAGFRHLFARARAEGYRAVAHAGEEGPPAYIREALDLLQVQRIDHGVRATEDPALLARLIRDQVPLTMCPLSNERLRVYDRLEDHPVLKLLEAGALVTVNSDDPAYFGGHLLENFEALRDRLAMRPAQAQALARNAVVASFLPPERKQGLLAEIDSHGAS